MSKIENEPVNNEGLVGEIASEAADYAIYLLATQNPKQDIDRETLIMQIIELRQIANKFFNLLMDCKAALQAQPTQNHNEDMLGMVQPKDNSELVREIGEWLNTPFPSANLYSDAAKAIGKAANLLGECKAALSTNEKD